MDINQTLQPVVASLIDNLKASIEGELRSQITEEILKKIATTEIDSIISSLVEQQISNKVDKFDFVNASHEQLTNKVAKLTDQINNTIAASAQSQINGYLSQKLAQINLTDTVSDMVSKKVAGLLTVQSFPPQSISHTSINFTGVSLSGDFIKGGIIEKFGSTGIEDLSSHVQMTLMDHAVAFEGPIWAPEAKITGNLSVEGSLILNGDVDLTSPALVSIINKTSEEVKLSLDSNFFSQYNDSIFGKINAEGLDLNRITQNGREVIKDSQLGYQITDSNLQRLGLVRDLQTQGEAYLSQTLYVTTGRVGINTMDPAAAFSVWDQEVEINIQKRKQDVGYIGTARSQQLIIGSNNKDNLVLSADGSVYIEQLSVGGVTMSSADSIPNSRGDKGNIVWNNNPAPGAAIGWVCLGGTLWAKFGIIE